MILIFIPPTLFTQNIFSKLSLIFHFKRNHQNLMLFLKLNVTSCFWYIFILSGTVIFNRLESSTHAVLIVLEKALSFFREWSGFKNKWIKSYHNFSLALHRNNLKSPTFQSLLLHLYNWLLLTLYLKLYTYHIQRRLQIRALFVSLCLSFKSV